MTELCAKAEINRSTFYTHYVDLFDLMDKIKEEIKAEILEHMIDHYSAEPALFMESTIHFLNYLKDNANLYLHLYNETDSNCLREQMWQKTKDMHLKQGGHPDMYAEFRLRFKTFGITSVINDWVGNKKNVPAEDIAGLIIKFSDITL
ncbi:TetR family transcriptional regulator [Clostridia bacterium]|nr:TetR family transcriptional regulator [Clostridia bacterium]